MSQDSPPSFWHGLVVGDLFGDATETVFALVGILLLICTLSGQWWMAAYATFAGAVGGVALMFSVYLEYNAQRTLEEQAREAKRTS